MARYHGWRATTGFVGRDLGSSTLTSHWLFMCFVGGHSHFRVSVTTLSMDSVGISAVLRWSLGRPPVDRPGVRGALSEDILLPRPRWKPSWSFHLLISSVALLLPLQPRSLSWTEVLDPVWRIEIAGLACSRLQNMILESWGARFRSFLLLSSFSIVRSHLIFWKSSNIYKGN